MSGPTREKGGGLLREKMTAGYGHADQGWGEVPSPGNHHDERAFVTTKRNPTTSKRRSSRRRNLVVLRRAEEQRGPFSAEKKRFLSG